MGLVTSTVHKVTPPHEPDEWISIRKLSGLELEEAAQVAQNKAIKSLEGIDLSHLKDSKPDPNRSLSYDGATMLTYAVQDWSYDGNVDPALLDARTWQWLVGVVQEENVRPPG